MHLNMYDIIGMSQLLNLFFINQGLLLRGRVGWNWNSQFKCYLFGDIQVVIVNISIYAHSYGNDIFRYQFCAKYNSTWRIWFETQYGDMNSISEHDNNLL